MNLLRTIFFFTFFSACDRNRIIYIQFQTGFEHDRVVAMYDNYVVFDSIITTDYSVGLAGRVAFKEKANKTLLINIGGKHVDSLIVRDTMRGLGIGLLNDSIYFRRLVRTIRY